MATLSRAMELATQGSAGQLRDEYAGWTAIYEEQPAEVRRHLETQAREVAAALLDDHRRVAFTLPESVVASAADAPDQVLSPVPSTALHQQVGLNLIDRLAGTPLNNLLTARLDDLERSPDAALAVAGGLMRYAAARSLVLEQVPAGRRVVYGTAEGDEIPSLPQDDDFYLPQCAPFDGQGRLRAESLASAEELVRELGKHLDVLQRAVRLAPYMVTDQEYQAKRYGLLGQLVHQSRALAHYKLGEIVRIIRERAEAQDLVRGLSVSVPYFDDQALALRMYDFEIIPPGRVPFLPGFVVRAAKLEQYKVAQAPKLSTSSRLYLLAELRRLEHAFKPAARQDR